MPAMPRWLLLLPLLLGTGVDDADERARLLSLPYVASRIATSDVAGVTVHDSDRASAGLNLYTSSHAPEVVLMDMEGEVLHRWEYAFERAFRGKRETLETGFLRRAQLLSGGELLAIYQGGGLVKLDRNSRLEWALDAGVYNHLYVATDGTIYTIGKEARIVRELNTTRPVLEDSILVVSPDGELLRRVSLLEAFRDSDFAELLQPMADSGDIFHTNTVQLLEETTGGTGWPRGSVLVSLRELDIVAVVDMRRESVVWARRGGWRAQHQPTLLEGGTLLLFDNRGAAGRSRVIELLPASGEVVWEYGLAPGEQIFSAEAGSCQRLPNGNTLISESEAGRALEVTPGGEVVWEFRTPHRMPDDSRLVASLFEVVRIESEDVDWLW
jgi:hypothetical protein